MLFNFLFGSCTFLHFPYVCITFFDGLVPGCGFFFLFCWCILILEVLVILFLSAVLLAAGLLALESIVGFVFFSCCWVSLISCILEFMVICWMNFFWQRHNTNWHMRYWNFRIQ